jgi:EmrB/QacA subfamily drug resistance transporter
VTLDHGGILHRRHAVPDAPSGDGSAGSRRLALAVVCLCAFTTAIDITITNVALPFIAKDLKANTTSLQWIVDVYNIVLAGLLLLGGGLADRFGRKKIFLAGYGLFGVACAVAAFSTSTGALVAARALMGVGAAGVIAPALAILAVLFPPEERGPAVAAWAMFGAAGLAVGPIAGGLLLDHFWWGSVFLVNVPLVVVGVVVGLRVIPESRRPGAARLDAVGAVLSVAALSSLLAGVIEGPVRGWSDPFTLALLIGGVGLTAAFAWWELRSAAPMFDLRILRRPPVAAGAVALFVAYVSFTGMLFVIPQHLQDVRQIGVVATGLLLAPFAIFFSFGSSRASRVLERYGARRTLGAGLLVLGAGMAALALLPEAGAAAVVVAATLVLAGGLALLIAPATTVVINDLPVEKAGDGSSLNMLSRFAGAAFGVAFLGSVLASVYASRVTTATAGLSAGNAQHSRESISGALGVASGLSQADAHTLTVAARRAFDDAAQAAFLAGAVLALLAAAAALRALRGSVRPSPSEPGRTPSPSQAGPRSG